MWAKQFACHPEEGALSPTKDLGESREAARFLRRNNRPFGSLPYYFAASCAHFASVLKKAFALAGGSISPVSDAFDVTMCP